jgi:CheY-like chemotaxis protein
VLVAHGDPDYCAVMAEALQEEGYQLLTAHDGVDALLQIQRENPLAVVLEAALPKMYGFDMKRNETLQHIKVLLAVSQNGRNRYTRDPESMYGADDFIEEGRFREDLARKVSEVLSGPEPSSGVSREAPVPSPEPVSEREKAVEEPAGREAPVPDFEPSEKQGDGEPADSAEEAREKARRLARIIVSDIALYNEGVIDRGVRSGQLMNLIRDDLEEGYRLFRSRVPQDIAEEADYIREALNNLVEKKRAELGAEAVETIDAGQGEEKPRTPHRDSHSVEEGFSDDDF